VAWDNRNFFPRSSEGQKHRFKVWAERGSFPKDSGEKSVWGFLLVKLEFWTQGPNSWVLLKSTDSLLKAGEKFGISVCCPLRWAILSCSHLEIKKVQKWWIHQVQPLSPTHQIKRHGEGRERRFITRPGTCHGKRQSKHSAHLQSSLRYRHELQV
jgi:hypothetical protein